MAAIRQQLLGLGLGNGAADWRSKAIAPARTAPAAQRLRVKAETKQTQRSKEEFAGLTAQIAIAPLVLSSVLLPESAGAVTVEQIAGTLNKVQEFTSSVTSTTVSTYETVAGAVQQAYAFLKPAVDVAVPIVVKASDLAIKAATPVVSGVASQAVKALQNAGVDTKPVLEAGQTAATVAGNAAEQTTTLIEGAKPVVSTTVDSLLTSDPLILAGEGGALILLYIIAPPIISTIGAAARGYKGGLTAPQALDFVSNRNYVLVDVRTEKEKSKSGLPSLPNKAKKNLIAIPIEEFPSKLRSQLRDPRGVEAQVAALKIASLKKVNKGTNVIILDSGGNISKAVAKSLSTLGFKNTWIVDDGFNGSRGWVQNRLGTESYYSSLAEVLSPSRVIPATTKLFSGSSTSSSIVDIAPRSNKLLPSGE